MSNEGDSKGEGNRAEAGVILKFGGGIEVRKRENSGSGSESGKQANSGEMEQEAIFFSVLPC